MIKNLYIYKIFSYNNMPKNKIKNTINQQATIVKNLNQHNEHGKHGQHGGYSGRVGRDKRLVKRATVRKHLTHVGERGRRREDQGDCAVVACVTVVKEGTAGKHLRHRCHAARS